MSQMLNSNIDEKQEIIMSEQVQEIQSPETSPAMPAGVKQNEPTGSSSAAPSETSMAWLVLAIEKIPKEYWPNLLQIIKLYGESVALKEAQQKSWEKIKEELKNPDPVVELARQKALSEMLAKWEEEGDEEEQTETAEILRKALEEDPVSI
jgi:hypothetical protein